MTPEVSVVISVKNRSVMLWDCFVGLAAQTLGRDRFEVVVIDNVSSDDLGVVFERARKELGLLLRTARTKEDRGPAPARNMGVGMAASTIIAFTDSDCRPDPAWLAKGLEAFADEGIAFATGPVLAKPGQVVTLTSKLTFESPVEHPTFPTANAFFRRPLFLEFGGFDATLSFSDPFGRATECADTDLAWRLIEAGHRRTFLPEAIVFHEIEHLGFWMWLIEPGRLYVLPLLIRRHPGLRRELLTAGLFFHPRSWILYAGGLLVLSAVVVWPWLFLLVLAVIIGRAYSSTRSLDPRDLLRFCGHKLLHLPRHLTMTAALIYGSIRFRCLVL